MSRGLGKVERAVLATVPDHGEVAVTDLCARIYGGQATESEKIALRRSVRSLTGKGLLTTRGGESTVPVTYRIWRGNDGQRAFRRYQPLVREQIRLTNYVRKV